MISQNLWLSGIGVLLGIPLGVATLKFLIKKLASEYNLPLDYVVETKTSGLWEYTRWNSGRVEMKYAGEATFGSGYSIRYTPVGWKISSVSDNVKSPSIFVTERYLGTNRSVDGVFTAGGMEYISANDNYGFAVYGRRAGAAIATTIYIDILIKGWHSE